MQAAILLIGPLAGIMIILGVMGVNIAAIARELKRMNDREG